MGLRTVLRPEKEVQSCSQTRKEAQSCSQVIKEIHSCSQTGSQWFLCREGVPRLLSGQKGCPRLFSCQKWGHGYSQVRKEVHSGSQAGIEVQNCSDTGKEVHGWSQAEMRSTARNKTKNPSKIHVPRGYDVSVIFSFIWHYLRDHVVSRTFRFQKERGRAECFGRFQTGLEPHVFRWYTNTLKETPFRPT